MRRGKEACASYCRRCAGRTLESTWHKTSAQTWNRAGVSSGHRFHNDDRGERIDGLGARGRLDIARTWNRSTGPGYPGGTGWVTRARAFPNRRSNADLSKCRASLQPCRAKAWRPRSIVPAVGPRSERLFHPPERPCSCRGRAFRGPTHALSSLNVLETSASTIRAEVLSFNQAGQLSRNSAFV